MLRAKTRFDDSFKRIRNQDSIYKHLVSTLHFPEKDISDMLRSEVVYAVSSFDSLNLAVLNLKKREGTNEKYIGSYNKSKDEFSPIEFP